MMDTKMKQFKLGAGSGDNTNLLRIGVVFMSIVSFFTTANGMKSYIFVNDGTIAYAASAAIQGILLALSMYLPTYLQSIWERPGRENLNGKKGVGSGILRFFLCVFVILLTIVTLFCSSWFSYVYRVY